MAGGRRPARPADGNRSGANCVSEAAMRFEDPQVLWLLLVLPPAFGLFFWWAGRRLRAALLLLAAALLTITLARPQLGFDLEEVEQRGLDIMVAVDTSKSML